MIDASVRGFRRRLMWQFLLLLVTSSVLWFWGPVFAQSFFAGGAVTCLGQGLFLWIAGQSSGATRAREVTKHFYMAQAIKFLVTVLGMVTCLRLLGAVSPVAMLLGFVLMQLIWVVGMARSSRG